MSIPRILLHGIDATYHCVSRTVGQEKLFRTAEKDYMMDLLYRACYYCGAQLLNFELMGNHYHVVVQMPPRRPINDEELVDRYRCLYGSASTELKGLEIALEKGGAVAACMRQKIWNRMYDISVFQKIFKERTSRWYNRQHERTGTLWDGPYKSLVVENSLEALGNLGVYLTLNPVRANMHGRNTDPTQYRWSGYYQALKGCEICRKGICAMMGEMFWEEALKKYNAWMAEVSRKQEVKGRLGMSDKVIAKLMKPGKYDGSLPEVPPLLQKIRYFSSGLAIGSKEFVEELFEENPHLFGPKRKSGARKMRGGDWGELRTLRDLKKDPIIHPDRR